MSSTQSTVVPTLSQNGHPETMINDDITRKPSVKRTTTAERRATHNAVERARRETLNGRFLLLASLLPNLSQIRRPSKSAVVNSSIAHVNASRRHRMLASRVTQDLLRETEELRRELNEWRERAGVRQLEPRLRTEGFGMVLRGELEPISINPGEEDEEDDLHFQEQMNVVAGRPPQMGPLYSSPSHRALHPHPTASPYGSTIASPIAMKSVASAPYDLPHHTSNLQVAPAPHNSPPAVAAIHPPHNSLFSHQNDASYVCQDADTRRAAFVQTHNLLVPHWSDDSSSTSSLSMDHPQSGQGSGYNSIPHSPASYEPLSSSAGSLDFNYETEGGYEVVSSGPSSGSSDGFYGSISHGFNGPCNVAIPGPSEAFIPVI